MRRFDGKVVLVTGGASGIGRACALRLAEEGASLALWDVQAAALDATAKQAREHGAACETAVVDVTDEAQVRAAAALVDAEVGDDGLDGLVNNAGVVDVAARVQDMSMARWRRLFDTNVLGAFACAREAVRRMSTRHGGQGGAIVNVSSMAARLGAANQYVDYAATKAAIEIFTLGLAHEVAQEGIRVNAVRPGVIDTDIHASGGQPDRAWRLAPAIPMQRPGTADEVAQAICWLLGDEASYTTGSVLDVGGGR